MQLRLATRADLDALVAFIARYYAYDGIPFDLARIRPAAAALVEDPALGRAWYIEQDAAVAGYVVLTFGFDHEFGGRIGTVTDLFIEEPFRRRGLGTATLKAVEDFAVAAGLHGLELQVEPDNLEAQALYDKSGFQQIHRLLMCKELGPMPLASPGRDEDRAPGGP